MNCHVLLKKCVFDLNCCCCCWTKRGRQEEVALNFQYYLILVKMTTTQPQPPVPPQVGSSFGLVCIWLRFFSGFVLLILLWFEPLSFPFRFRFFSNFFIFDFYYLFYCEFFHNGIISWCWESTNVFDSFFFRWVKAFLMDFHLQRNKSKKKVLFFHILFRLPSFRWLHSNADVWLFLLDVSSQKVATNQCKKIWRTTEIWLYRTTERRDASRTSS